MARPPFLFLNASPCPIRSLASKEVDCHSPCPPLERPVSPLACTGCELLATGQESSPLTAAPTTARCAGFASSGIAPAFPLFDKRAPAGSFRFKLRWISSSFPNFGKIQGDLAGSRKFLMPASCQQPVQPNRVTPSDRCHPVIGHYDQIDLAEDLACFEALNQSSNFTIDFEHGLLRFTRNRAKGVTRIIRVAEVQSQKSRPLIPRQIQPGKDRVHPDVVRHSLVILFPERRTLSRNLAFRSRIEN